MKRPDKNRPDKPDVDNGSDHDTGVDQADADESGYRRDDYWRAVQEGRVPGDGDDEKALREREANRTGETSKPPAGRDDTSD